MDNIVRSIKFLEIKKESKEIGILNKKKEWNLECMEINIIELINYNE